MKALLILLLIFIRCTINPSHEVVVIKKVPYEKPVIIFINDCKIQEVLFQIAKETLLEAHVREYNTHYIIDKGLDRIDKLALDYHKQLLKDKK